MKKAKRFISAVMAAVMAFTVNVSVMAETVSEPEMIDINGYPCYERDGQYWTVLDGEEYLVINLDEIMDEPMESGSDEDSGINPCSGIVDECPIGTPPLLVDWIYNGCVELSEANNYTYDDRCYLTYGDYYSPIYYFQPKKPKAQFVAKIDADVFDEKYYLDIWKHHSNTNEWKKADTNKLFQFNFILPPHSLLTGSETQLIDGLGLKFLTSSPGNKELNYNIRIYW